MKRLAIIVAALAASLGMVEVIEAQTAVYSIAKKSTAKISSGAPYLTLKVPDGNYAIVASFNVDNDDTSKVQTVFCSLMVNGVKVQEHVVRLGPSGTKSLDSFSVTLNGAMKKNGKEGSNNISIVCVLDQVGANVTIRNPRITAMKVESFGSDTILP